MKTVSWLFRILLGGGRRHQLAICAAAIVAAEKHYRTADMTNWRPGQGGEQPDLVIETMDRMISGPHRSNGRVRYRIEVVDAHDPIIDYKTQVKGYDDILKIELVRADEYCQKGHPSKPPVVPVDGPRFVPHMLCVEGLFWLCDKVIP